MNQTEQENYAGQFKPLKQIIKVFKVDNDGRRTEWFRGFLVGVTSRGLLINPFGEYGESVDPLAASFIAFPQYRKNNVSFSIENAVK